MKILAIASAGGHWIQLLRLKPAFQDHELIFMSTKETFADTVEGHEFYCIPDANRNNKLLLIKSALKVLQILWSIKPDVVITTGAAPGLMAIFGGKILGAKTIWIDSVANVDELSMSGNIASKFADRVYTQWEHLSNNKVKYNGSVVS